MQRGVTEDFGQSDTEAVFLVLSVIYLLSNKFQLTLHQLSIEGVPIPLDRTWALWDLVC